MTTGGVPYDVDWTDDERAEFTDKNYLTLPSALDGPRTTVLTAFELQPSPDGENSQERPEFTV